MRALLLALVLLVGVRLSEALSLPSHACTDQHARRQPRATAMERRVLLAWGVGGLFPAISAASASRQPVRSIVDEASLSFQRGEYGISEQQWRAATEASPDLALAWANLAVVLLINASQEMTLGEPPVGRAKARCEEAVSALDRAEAIEGAGDALSLNTRGNALALLLRWEEAQKEYARAADVARRDFESIPRSNLALVQFQLGALADAERTANKLVRRDPGFRDGFALLAALRLEQDDVAGAVRAFDGVCAGSDGGMWCNRYSTEEVVMGRWTPRAVDSYRKLLKLDAIKREIRNAQALTR